MRLRPNPQSVKEPSARTHHHQARAESNEEPRYADQLTLAINMPKRDHDLATRRDRRDNTKEQATGNDSSPM